MTDLRAQFEAWLETLLAGVPARQRPLLFIGLGLFSLLLVWLLLLAPVAASRAALSREIDAKKEELAWMRKAANEVRILAKKEGNGKQAGSRLATIEESAKKMGMGQAIQKVEPAGDHEVRIWLENAVFDEMMRWLSALKTSHGIEVAEITVEQSRAGAGLVSSRLTLVNE